MSNNKVPIMDRLTVPIRIQKMDNPPRYDYDNDDDEEGLGYQNTLVRKF